MLQVEILCRSYVYQPNVYMGVVYITFCYVGKHNTKWLIWNGMVSSYDFELYVDIRLCSTNGYQLMWYHVVPHGTILIDCGTMWYGMILWCCDHSILIWFRPLSPWALFPRTIWLCSIGDLHTTHVVPHGTTVICTSYYNVVSYY
jgi:hypothetical protein